MTTNPDSLRAEIINAKREALRASETAASAARWECYAEVRACRARLALINLIGEDEYGSLDVNSKYVAILREQLASAEKRLAECDGIRPVAAVPPPAFFDAEGAADAESVCEFGARAAGLVLADSADDKQRSAHGS